MDISIIDIMGLDSWSGRNVAGSPFNDDPEDRHGESSLKSLDSDYTDA
jgi:hypothetical protein